MLAPSLHQKENEPENNFSFGWTTFRRVRQVRAVKEGGERFRLNLLRSSKAISQAVSEQPCSLTPFLTMTQETFMCSGEILIQI